MKQLRTIVAAVAIVATAGLLAACGSSSDSSTSGSAQSAPAGPSKASGGGDLKTIKVGSSRSASLATTYIGIQKGFYAEEGLKLDLVPTETAAAGIAQVLAGQLNITYAPTASVMAADVNGADLKMIANQGGLIDPNEASSAIVVLPKSPIKRPADLVGKKVGVIALKSELDVLLHQAVKQDGGNEKQVQSVQIPFPQMYNALKAGRVAAVVTTEPFLTIAEKAGVRSISDLEVKLLPRASTGTWAATSKYIGANQETIAAFQRANAKSLAYTKTHQDEVRAMLPKVTDMAPALAKVVRFGYIFEPEVNVASVQKLGEMMEDLGYLKNVPPASQLVVPQPAAR